MTMQWGEIPPNNSSTDTVVHHSSSSTYMPNFIEIKELFVDRRTYAHTDEQTDISHWLY